MLQQAGSRMPAGRSTPSSAVVEVDSRRGVPVARNPVVKVTGNFERNLEDIEHFLGQAGATEAFDSLLSELLESVVPNLERFPQIGRPFLARAAHSVEATNTLAALGEQLSSFGADADALREYVLQ